MADSGLTDAGRRVGGWRRLGEKIQSLLYASYFLPIFLAIGFLTGVLTMVKFKLVLLVIHRLFGFERRVVYLEAFFAENAGYHYRVRKWIEVLNGSDFQARSKCVFERDRYEQLLRDQRIIRFQTIFLLHRIWHCVLALGFNCVIVRRELLLFNDYGGLFLERFLLAMHPNVVLDFDDDISAAKREPRRLRPFGRLLFENPAKFTASLGLYNRFIAGSSYLKTFVLTRNPKLRGEDVLVTPTCVDYEKYPAKDYAIKGECTSFGWIGANNTMHYLNIVMPALKDIAQRHKIRLIVISGQDYEPDVSFEVVNIRWSLSNEIEELRNIDIGLMPLYDGLAERGKCGLKLIQYMGIGIVSIASAITANNEIIDDKRNGFLVRNESDWVTVIEEVLAKRDEYLHIGLAARRKIADNFSFEANRRKYIDFIGRLDWLQESMSIPLGGRK